MLDQAIGASTVTTNETSDGDLFNKITGRKLRTPRRFFNTDSAKLHKAQRAAFEEMPSIGEVCERFATSIEAEQRRDDKIKLSELQVDDVGALRSTRGDIIPGSSNLGILEQAWAQLVSRAPKSVPSRLKSNVNAWASRATGTAVARTMDVEGARDVFALVSERFQPHDGDEVAREVARAMPSECKGSVKYHSDGGRFEIEAVLARPIDIDGEIHRVVACFRSSDNGTMAQQIAFKAWRLKCLNGMFIADRQVLTRLWHKGDPTRLRDQFAAGAVMAATALQSFADHWKRARRDRFVDTQTGSDLTGPEALRRLVGRGDVVVPGVRPSDLIARLNTAWQAEPGDTVADTLNAITKSAHTTAWPVAWSTESLEQVAGEILYGRTLGLPALSANQLEMLAA